MQEIPTSRDFYILLQVPSNADTKTIQKAFRKLSLKYHPDKTNNNPTLTEHFQLLKRAYDVLTDEKKRKIYDKYGERGIVMVESMGEFAPFIDPDLILQMNTLFFIGTILAALLLLFPIFISLKVDEKVSWTWATVFIPIFILDGLFLLSVLTRPLDDSTNHESDIDESSTQNSQTALNDDNPAKSKEMKLKSRISKYFSILKTLGFITFQILLVLKLDSGFKGSWQIVFTPWLILEFFNLIDIFYSMNKRFSQGIPSAFNPDTTADENSVSLRPLTISEKSSIFIDYFIFWLLRVIQVCVLIVKLEGAITAGWATVFIPIWLWIFFKIIGIILLSLDHAATPTKRNLIISSAVMFVITHIFIYVTFGLLTSRLTGDGNTPSAPIILIPVFIVTGTIFCCIGCCLPCSVCCLRLGIEEQLKNPQNLEKDEVVVVSPDKRITEMKV